VRFRVEQIPAYAYMLASTHFQQVFLSTALITGEAINRLATTW
jgi:hypothetical protein